MLRRCLSPDFDSASILAPGAIVLNDLGSATDVYSGLIFQHDLQTTGRELPNHLAIQSCQEKHKFLFARFNQDIVSAKVMAFRWIRGGHPDADVRDAFEGESPINLLRLLQALSGHHNVIIVEVKTVLTNTLETHDLIRLTKTEYGYSAVIKEAISCFRSRDDFRGDDHAWTSLFEHIDSSL